MERARGHVGLRSLPLPPEASEPGESLAEHDAAFERTLDLDRDGSLERALVGVYASADGATGRFLLVTPAGAKRAGPTALLELPGGAGFSALFVSGGKLFWASCMECDSSCEVRLQAAPARLECVAEPDGD